MGATLTASELSGLAGMTERSVRRRGCELERAKSSKPALNGQFPLVYQIESLSPKLQQRYLQQQRSLAKDEPAGEAPSEVALVPPSGLDLSTEDRAEAERRFRIIEPLLNPEKFRLLWAESALRKTALIAHLAQQHQLGARTLRRWVDAFRDGGLPALVRKARADKSRPRKLNPAALDFILTAACPKPGSYGELSVRDIYRAYIDERAWRATHAKERLCGLQLQRYARYVDPETGRLRESAQLPAASYDTVLYWYDRIPAAVKSWAREGEEDFHNTQEILSFRDLAAIKPLDYVVMDHRLLDVFTLVRTHTGWKLIRPWLTAAIDMRTRKWLAWVIVETPSSDSIASVLKTIFMKFGAPRSLYWDNGKDFTCEWLEGRTRKTGTAPRVGEMQDGVRGVLQTLGVRVHHAIVRRARSKIIEPNFVNTALFDRTLPEWCGHKPSARPERFDALLADHERWLKKEIPNPPFQTIEQVAALYSDFLESLNEREHTGQGMAKVTPTGRGWMCPNEAWELLIGKVERRTVDAAVLQFCFQKRKKVTIRNGELRLAFEGQQYHYRLIDSSTRLIQLNEREVEIAYDPFDLETGAVYYEDTFIGLVENIALCRMGADDFVQGERDRRRARRDVKSLIAAAHQQVYVPDARERLARRKAVEPARTEPDRPETAAAVPEALLEAARAKAADDSFAFSEVKAEPIAAAPADDSDDSSFSFFRGDR